MLPQGTQDYPSLLFQPRTEDRDRAEANDYRTPRPSRSPSAPSAFGRTTGFREGSVRRRSLTPSGDQGQVKPPTESLFLTDTLAGDSLTGNADAQASQPEPPEPQPGQSAEETWVTVFGFQPSELHVVLREFSKCGDMVQFGSGRQDAVNWVHIHYSNKYQAQRALQRNGELLASRTMVGVRRLDARHKAATAHVSHAAFSSLAGPASDPSLANPPRPYHVSAAPSVRPIPSPSTVWGAGGLVPADLG